MVRLALGVILTCLSAPVWAAAWLQAPESWQAISTVLYTDASHTFDVAQPTHFQRMLLQTDINYGWNDRLTLFAHTETAFVHLRDPWRAFDTVSNAFEGGARYQLGAGLLRDYDVLSVEAMARTAGAFNSSVSAGAAGAAGGQAGGVRLLYGTPYKLAGLNGFVNMEAGMRFLAPPRPREMQLDLTAGLWLTPANMVMVQSFNLISGPAHAPYSRFRSHKMQLSWVWRIARNYAVQTGAYFSPAGANTLQENGLLLSVWIDS
jgi:hypothetical protein